MEAKKKHKEKQRHFNSTKVLFQLCMTACVSVWFVNVFQYILSLTSSTVKNASAECKVQQFLQGDTGYKCQHLQKLFNFRLCVYLSFNATTKDLWGLTASKLSSCHCTQNTIIHPADLALSLLILLTYGPGQVSDAVDVLHLCPDTQGLTRYMHGHVGVYSQLALWGERGQRCKLRTKYV